MKLASISFLLLCSSPLRAQLARAQLTLKVGATVEQPTLTIDAREGFMPVWQDAVRWPR